MLRVDCRCSCGRLKITLNGRRQFIKLLVNGTYLFLHERKIDALLWRRVLGLEQSCRPGRQIDGRLKLHLRFVRSFEAPQHLAIFFGGLRCAHHLIGILWIRI